MIGEIGKKTVIKFNQPLLGFVPQPNLHTFFRQKGIFTYSITFYNIITNY